MRWTWTSKVVAALLMLVGLAGAVGAKEYVLPLREGKVKVREMNAAISGELHVITIPTSREVDLNGPEGADFLLAVNACLWKGCSLETRPGEAVLRLEPPAKGTCMAMRRMARVIAAERAPAATAAQARHWGLVIADKINPKLPLVVLIHGVDADKNDCAPLGTMLRDAGYQVAYFSYPGDQPIEDSAAMLARSMRLLHEQFPTVRTDFVCHSMGGLVARRYIEGEEYKGGVHRLIMVGTPNHGSGWAHFRTALSVQEHYYLRADPEWAWTWLITEGMGEAGDDLLPGSDFLKDLNARPRREGVHYTIIAGNKSGVNRAEANVVDSVADWMPVRARRWWGFGHCYRGLVSVATHLREKTSDGDGPVSLKSAELKGVKDVVVLPGDHVSLFLPTASGPPMALAVIRERLKG